MTGYITDCNGQQFRLPMFLSWEVCHTDGTNGTDYFQIEFPYEKDMKQPLEDTVYVQVIHNNDTVFYGVLDEYEITVNQKGRTVNLIGRGMGARLIDNKCVGAEYVTCTIDEILKKYVYPFGVKVGKCDSIKPVYGYSVDTGESAMAALTGYTRFSAGITPRFSTDGKLLLTKEKGAMYAVDVNQITDIILRSRRSGVLSEVKVVTVDGVQTVVKNETFIKKGGYAGGVVTVPRNTGWDAIRYTGSYQIEKSMEDCYTLELTVKELFPVFPGNIAEISGEFCEAGKYTVTETCCFGSEEGIGTKVYLKKEMK